MVSDKAVTLVKTGVPGIHNDLKRLDSGACPGPDPGSGGIEENHISGLITKSSSLICFLFHDN
jgi:hypothetical protein